MWLHLIIFGHASRAFEVNRSILPCRLLTRDFITFVATHLHRAKGEMSHFGYQCNVIMMSHETKKISLTTPLTIYIKIVKQERFTSCVYNRA